MKLCLRIAFGLSILCCWALLSNSSAAATVGAYYYPWWGQGGGGHTFNQTLRARLPSQDQLPLIGDYDNRDFWTTASHIDQSQAANVSVWSLSWRNPNWFEDGAIRDHILPNPLASRLDYTVHYESTGRLVPSRHPITPTLFQIFDIWRRTSFPIPTI